MDYSTAIDEPRLGVRFIDMDRRSGLGLDRALRRLGFRIEQALVTMVLRRGLALKDGDPARYQAFLDGWRAFHLRLEPKMQVLIEANAVKTNGMKAGLPAPPSPSEWFAPVKGEAHGAVFYVHGGSFIAERSPRITALVAQFSAAAGARVFAPSYRLAPEHPCPAAVDDIEAAFTWFAANHPDEPVVALAESAGAAILLAALQRVREAGGPMPEGVVLLSPWVDLSLQSWSVIAASMAGTSPYTMESLALMAHLYLNGRPATDPIASPLYGDFDGFPPMLIHASKGDILYDDAVRLADKVREAGGDLTVRLWSDETHVWEQTHSAKARQSIQLAAEFIRRRLG